MADIKQHLGLLLPAGVFPFQEMTKEPLLQIKAVIGIELGPMLATMHLEPFVLARRIHKSVDIAARM